MSEALDTAVIARGYAEADRDFRVHQARIGCLLVLVCMPLGVLLDWFVYPKELGGIFASRLLCDVAVLPVFALLYTGRGRRHIGILGVVWALLPAVDISWMIWRTMGADSSYYAGLILVMIVACQLMPYTFGESLLVCLSVIGLYLLACVTNKKPVHADLFVNNVYFLGLTALICVTSNHYTTRRRMEEYRLRHELDVRNGEIAESYKKLSELDRLKSEFFANISHELRTPLTLIVSPIEHLMGQSRGLPDGAHPSLVIARQNALRLLHLINDLLELVRLEERRADLAFEPLDLGAFVAAMADSVRHLSAQKGLTLVAAGEPGLVVPADPGRMEKVVLNVLTNAIKFTPPGGRIGVAWRREEDRAVVEFTDTGVGIAEGQLPYIFDRFRQADGSSTRKYQGAGIGLALARDLAREHGGRLTARSRLGEGATFRLDLPVAGAGVAAAPAAWAADAGARAQDPIARVHYDAQRTVVIDAEIPAPAAEEPPDPAPPAGGGRRYTVLVVDDEPDMRRFLAAALADSYRVLQAADGRAGLDAARRDVPDLVLLDLMLPEIDGLDVCEALRADDRTARMKIVLLTARTDEETKLKALKRGADDFLTKPFSLAEVRTRLANLLKAAALEENLRGRNAALQDALDKLRATEVQLVQSEKMNALGKLSAGLLHEINNPLNFTLTAIQIARDTAPPDDADLHDTLKDIEEGMQRIRNIVSDLRTFAYPSKDGSREPLAVRDVVRTALHLAAHELRGVPVDQDGVGDGQVPGDKTQLTHVFLNLLVNSAEAVRRAGPGRPPQIRVRAWRDDGRMRVSVWDNGEGIPPDVLPRVFEPFFTTRDVGQGMGLGLSICHTIVANHGGTLRARSEPGEWTEVDFDLPLAQDAAPPAARRPAGERAAMV